MRVRPFPRRPTGTSLVWGGGGRGRTSGNALPPPPPPSSSSSPASQKGAHPPTHALPPSLPRHVGRVGDRVHVRSRRTMIKMSLKPLLKGAAGGGRISVRKEEDKIMERTLEHAVTWWFVIEKSLNWMIRDEYEGTNYSPHSLVNSRSLVLWIIKRE